MKNDLVDPFTSLGDECKTAEELEAGRCALPSEVIMVRLDGHGFSKFTKGLARPYDERLSKLMIDVVKHLVEQTHAIVGYTQSDEISLVFKINPALNEQHYFGGRFQKIASTCAAMATSFFTKHLTERLPEKAHLYPTFDGRAWAVGPDEAYKNLLWRERDATKNSITMAATEMFGHAPLQHVNGDTKKQMMLDAGVDWNDYPTFFKRGVYIKRVTILKNLTAHELARIPADKRPDGAVERSAILQLDLPQINRLKDFAAVLFTKKMSPHVELRDGGTYTVFDYNILS